MRVVAIGGGTGLSTLLRGLRRHVAVPHQSMETAPIADLAAVVTVTDDGGSSGRLRRGFNMLPPGDLRNCMVALS
ncbi:MAG: gluconeogenesis factor YvcK family protein, partial [Terracidiphilus sp.]